ncbi:UNVERIFIED_ORG: hypothetical protein ABIC54_003172 [Burkholderia sp. 1263]
MIQQYLLATVAGSAVTALLALAAHKVVDRSFRKLAS